MASTVRRKLRVTLTAAQHDALAEAVGERIVSLLDRGGRDDARAADQLERAWNQVELAWEAGGLPAVRHWSRPAGNACGLVGGLRVGIVDEVTCPDCRTLAAVLGHETVEVTVTRVDGSSERFAPRPSGRPTPSPAPGAHR